MTDIQILEKGAPITISEKAPGLKNLYIGMGWDTNKAGGADFDLDVTVVLANAQKKLSDANHLVYYGNLEFKKADGTPVVIHSKDDTSGGTSDVGDDEYINLKLDQMPADIEHAFIFVNIYQAKERNQHFGLVENSFIRLMDGDTEKEFARYELKKEFANNSGVMVADIYRLGAEWKAKVLAEPVDGTIEEILKKYNLE